MQARQTIKTDYNLEGEIALRHPCLAGEDVEADLPIPSLNRLSINIGSRGGRKPENQKGGYVHHAIYGSAPPVTTRKPWTVATTAAAFLCTPGLGSLAGAPDGIISH